MYVAGLASEGAKKLGVVFRSSDAGRDWLPCTAIDLDSSFAGANFQIWGILSDANALVVTGAGKDSRGHTRTYVYRSEDKGDHWAQVDIFPSATVDNSTSFSFGIKEGINKNLYYVSLYSNIPDRNWRAVLRESHDSGRTWFTRDEFAGSAGAILRNFTFDQQGNIYTVGFERIEDPVLKLVTVVRRCEAAGGNCQEWARILPQTLPSYPNDFLFPTNESYLVGLNEELVYTKETEISRWSMVLCTLPAHHCRIADAVQVNNGHSEFQKATQNTKGQIFAVGTAWNATTGPTATEVHAITRISSDAGQTWSMLDDNTTPDIRTRAQDVLVESAESILVIGDARPMKNPVAPAIPDYTGYVRRVRLK